VGDGYDIIHDSAFDADLKTLFGSARAGDAACHGVMWMVAAKPSLGKQMTQAVWSLEITHPTHGAVLVLYTLNPVTKAVTFLRAVRRATP
jgi:hypothetical protein